MMKLRLALLSFAAIALAPALADAAITITQVTSQGGASGYFTVWEGYHIEVSGTQSGSYFVDMRVRFFRTDTNQFFPISEHTFYPASTNWYDNYLVATPYTGGGPGYYIIDVQSYTFSGGLIVPNGFFSSSFTMTPT